MFIKNIIYCFMRIFIKITGIIPYFLYAKPKYIFYSEKAKKEFKKRGAILVSNHSELKDYYTLLFRYPFRIVHTFVAEVIYKKKGLRFLNNVMGNIEINRDISENQLAIYKALELLKRNKTILIFPEGRLEDKKGKLLEFTKTFAFLSLKTGRPIIPYYIDGEYGIFKRLRVVVGEAIYPSGDIDTITTYTKDCIKKLGTIAKDNKKYKLKTIFTFKYWFHDLVRIISIPVFYFIFPVIKKYIGNKKEIRKALKYNVIVCSNHCGPCDPMYLYLHFLSRRMKIIAAEELWNNNFYGFMLDRAGAIKYRRKTMTTMDLIAFKEATETLNGRGCLGLFPEGHIKFNAEMDSEFKEGAAALSLMTNSPIIPFIFVEPFKYFYINHVIYGDVIYPKDCFKEEEIVANASSIDTYNKYIYGKMKELYDLALKMRKKKYGKNRYFKNT